MAVKNVPLYQGCPAISRGTERRLSMKPYSLDVLLVNVLPVDDSENEDLISQDSADYPVIADAIFPKTCELSFEDWIGVSVLRKLFLDLAQDAASFCLRQLLKVTLN
jgi:hypothetical protein